MKQKVPNPDEIEAMLYEIYKVMDARFNPCCSKCHCKIVTCDCEIDKEMLREAKKN